MRILHLVWGFTILFLLEALGQEMPPLNFDKNFKINEITRKDGLPPGRIWGIHRGQSGYLWFTINSFLCRYDGKEVKAYQSKSSYNPEIFEDDQGKVWLSGNKGLVQFDPLLESFHYYQEEDQFGTEWTEEILIDSRGILWHGLGNKLQMIDLNNNPDSLISFFPYEPIKQIKEPLEQILQSVKLLAELTKIGDNANEEKVFQITDEQKVLIINQGQFFMGSLADFGWIENEKGDTIWKAIDSESKFAGGFLPNRIQIDTISLKSGKYRLRFRSNHWYSYNQWLYEDGAPTIPDWWGIQAFAINDQQAFEIMELWNKEKSKKDLSEGEIRPFLDHQGNLWIASFGNIDQVVYEEKKDGTIDISFENYVTGENWVPQNADILQDANFDFHWISIFNLLKNGNQALTTMKLDLSNADFQIIDHPVPFKKVSSELVGFPPFFNCLEMDLFGNLWFTVWSGKNYFGLYRIPQTSLMGKKTVTGNPIQVISSNVFGALEIDKDNFLWLGSDLGIQQVNLNPGPVKLVDLSNQIIGEDIRYTRIFREQSGIIWLACPMINTLIRYDEQSHSSEQITNLYGIESPFFLPLLEDSQNQFWWGAKNQLIRKHLQNGKLDIFPLETNPERQVETFELIELSIEKYVVNSAGNVYIFNSLTQKFTPVLLTSNDVDSEIRSILKDTENRFWMIDRFGMITHVSIEGEKTSFLKKYNANIPNTAAHLDREGNIWISSWEGLLKYFPDQDSTILFSYEHGLPFSAGFLGKVIEDQNSNLWIPSPVDNTIYQFDVKEERYISFSDLTNYQVGAFNHTSTQSNSGKSYNLAKEGFITFHPDSITKNQKTPQLKILDIKVADRSLTENQDLPPIHFGMNLVLPYNQNDISFEYNGIHFEDGPLVTYSYQLEGVNIDWVQTGKEKIARFTNLNPGNYAFKVRAANADGVWSAPHNIRLIIKPPWWQTWWAYALYTLAAIAVLFWFVQTQRKKVIAKQKELEKEQQHSQELEQLNTKLQNINQANERFVPKDFLSILGKESIEDLRLGDQTQTNMTILFSDIRSYTTLSETMSPEDNFKFINGYLGRVGPIIDKHGGFIGQYFGDGLMALFLDDHQAAVNTAIEMQQSLDAYNKERTSKGRPGIKTGIGLNTGLLMLGIIGDNKRYDSTVISDAVNTASRMEGLTKIFGASIILSERTLQQLDIRESPFAYRFLGKVKVKGKDKALKIYDLYEGDAVDIRELKAQTKLKFETGIGHYFNRQFGKSAECFKQVLQINNIDRAAQYYLDKSIQYIVDGVSEDWSGVEEMLMK